MSKLEFDKQQLIVSRLNTQYIFEILALLLSKAFLSESCI